MISQVLSNWICWVILIVALVCYQQLWMTYLMTEQSQNKDDSRQEFASILINTLPLLGLFGTIVGLLDCFAGMARGDSTSEVLSSGIADALITTQLGLVCAIPAWLLQAALRSRLNALGNGLAMRKVETNSCL